jgi:hypothetical protein
MALHAPGGPAAAITAAYACCARLRGLQPARLMALYGPGGASHDHEHDAPLILEGEVRPQGCALVIHGPLLLE